MKVSFNERCKAMRCWKPALSDNDDLERGLVSNADENKRNKLESDGACLSGSRE